MARRMGLEVTQPADVNSPELREKLRASGAEVLVISAFGQILQNDLLDSILCINVHASLLPAYRGAAPIERALAAGESHVGVSVMRVERALDSGPWALQTSLSVSLWDDAGSIGRALAFLGARGIDQVLTGIEDSTVIWTKQQGTTAYAEKLCTEDCLLGFSRPARAVHDQVRSLSPRVGARVSSGAVHFKVWRTWPYGHGGLPSVPADAAHVSGRPGVVAALKTRLFVGCSEGAVELLSIQPDGKSRMSTSEFLRGYREKLGSELSAPSAGSDSAGQAG